MAKNMNPGSVNWVWRGARRLDTLGISNSVRLGTNPQHFKRPFFPLFQRSGKQSAPVRSLGQKVQGMPLPASDRPVSIGGSLTPHE